MKRWIVACAILVTTAVWGGEKKSICLNMIVKDESAVIERCLESVKGLIDYWVIVDTGSSDGTQEVICKFLKEIPGELHERPWVDFGHNRNEALAFAKGKADYLLFMDADDKLAFSEGFSLLLLEKDFYVIATHAKGIECILPRLVKNDLAWHWHGALHEYISADRATEGGILEGVEYIYLSDGARSKDPRRHQKDIAILEQAIAREPGNARHLFYLAMTYWTMGDLPRAIECYEKRMMVDQDPEEVFLSKFYRAKAEERLGKEAALVESSYRDAYLYRPTRAEPLYHLARAARQTGRIKQCYQLASLGLFLPIQDAIFVDRWIYDYGLLLEYALSTYELGHYRESYDAATRLLQRTDLPEWAALELKALTDKLSVINLGQLILSALQPTP